ncbi:caspase family protein [Streptomyces sp. NPDC005820]|uniref:effector-associated domain 2-containing protein n=1 Tax=Streptomyces sp. NPDC005820 TaxID=3157069 RepID=UPI0033C11F51
MTAAVHPAHVHALIVGIESYAAGPHWNLPGPVDDALRFRTLMHAAGVPEANLHLHLAPLPGTTPAHPYRPADHASLRAALVGDLSSVADGRHLWVWWGGHGVLDHTDRLRLLCADATVPDKRSIDFDSSLARFRTDAVPGFDRQLWLADVCETFEEDLAFRHSLPTDTLPAGRRDAERRQVEIRAAGRGRRARNDPERRTGLFSEIVLELLREQLLAPPGTALARLPGVPDSMDFLSEIRARVAARRAAGQTEQLPHLVLRGPDGGYDEPPPRASVPSPARPHPREGARPGQAAVRRAVECLLAYPLMRDPVQRELVIEGIDARFTDRLRRNVSVLRSDIAGIVVGLSAYPEALGQLREAILVLDPDSGRGGELTAALDDLAGHDPYARGTSPEPMA